MRPLRRHGAPRRPCRGVAGVDAAAADPARYASDQLDRRHLELCDARTRPAQPHVRPRHHPRRSAQHPPRPRRRNPGDPRRHRTLARDQRRGHHRRERHDHLACRSHGWRHDRDLRFHDRGVAGDGVVGSAVDLPHREAPQPAERGLHSVPARRRLGRQYRSGDAPVHPTGRRVGYHRRQRLRRRPRHDPRSHAGSGSGREGQRSARHGAHRRRHGRSPDLNRVRGDDGRRHASRCRAHLAVGHRHRNRHRRRGGSHVRL